MAGILVMAAIPSGRRLISRMGMEPKWLLSTNSANTAMASRIGSMSMSPLHGERMVSRHHAEPAGHKGHGQHWGYAAILGVAAGIVALICFYLCVWLLRHMSRKLQRSNAQLPLEPEQQVEEDDGHGTKRARSGDGESATQTWNAESVELVVMAGEHVPTFVAHPVVQCPAQGNVPRKTSVLIVRLARFRGPKLWHSTAQGFITGRFRVQGARLENCQCCEYSPN